MPREKSGKDTSKKIETGKRFYDLSADPIASPYTGEVVSIGSSPEHNKSAFDDVEVSIVEVEVTSDEFGKQIIRERNIDTGEVAVYLRIRAFGYEASVQTQRKLSPSDNSTSSSDELNQEELEEAQFIAMSEHLRDLDQSAEDTLEYVKAKLGVGRV